MSDDRFSRKDLKQQDDFQRGATRFAAWLIERRKALGLGLLAIVAAVSVLAGVRAYQTRQEQNAAALLAAGLRVYNSAVIDEPDLDAAVAAALAQGDSYTSEQEKYEAAVAALRTVTEQYGNQPSGRAAYFYLGASLLELGQTQEAMAALETAGQSETPLIRAMALYRLGTVQLEQGDHDAAIATFDRLASSPPAGFPAEEALLAKAQAQEAAGDARGAMRTYRDIATDNPGSIYTLPAQTKAEELAASLGIALDAES